MTKREATNGEPYAGNPHVRSDEGGNRIGNARGEGLYSAQKSTLRKAVCRQFCCTVWFAVSRCRCFAGACGEVRVIQRKTIKENMI